MKITLDIDKLLAEGKIDQEDCDILKGLAEQESASLGLNLLLGFGVIAVAGGMLALMASAPAAMAIGVGVLALGVYLGINYAQQWGALGSVTVLVGALIFGGGLLSFSDGNLAAFLFLAIVYFAVGFVANSSLMTCLSAFALLGSLEAFVGYDHASYFFAIRQPTMSIVIFSALAAGTYKALPRFGVEDQRLLNAFIRACLFIVNLGFWIGSLWGDYLFNQPGRYEYGSDPTIPDLLFVITWAVALIWAGVWAANNGKRWLVNVAAVFGGIHFYTQWFERLGASPGAVVLAGLIMIAVALWLISYNRGFDSDERLA
jgi:hypothetical protein